MLRVCQIVFFFSSRRRHTRFDCDWSSDVCSSDLPDKTLKLERDMKGEENITSRIIDIIAPIGKGQRGLIVSPPKAGKTVLMQQLAHAITSNHPDVVLIVLLIDERPEEVTEMTRTVKGEVVASTFDEPIFPASTVSGAGTRREELLIEKEILQKVWVLRKLLYPMDDLEAAEFLVDKIRATKNNGDFFDSMRRG